MKMHTVLKQVRRFKGASEDFWRLPSVVLQMSIRTALRKGDEINFAFPS